MERKWTILLLVSIGMFTAFLDAPVVSVAFPAIETSFPGAAATTVAWTLDAYFIGFATFLVVGGRVADRCGRR
ncbi:MAG: MFS transporter, partial [Solirubrobacteraceae bacterium]